MIGLFRSKASFKLYCLNTQVGIFFIEKATPNRYYVLSGIWYHRWDIFISLISSHIFVWGTNHVKCNKCEEWKKTFFKCEEWRPKAAKNGLKWHSSVEVSFFKFDKCEVKYSWYAPLVYELQFLIRQCVDPRYGKVLAYKVPEQYT